ncbi:P-loop ATPase, Sll1717 family [Streptococcus mitis]|uniref:P-loop ATPase, Sll1717 family n=1 Tax=Streptococcus mitis TaxID=28037 RepID=UPI001CBA7CFA|nr:hypothetical protein [Streptococcus mitis]MBZ2106238.1 hypothetical protein [Streptococcus mitis]MBZ2113694.1 hypothetical protein [Streptococcus mitis]
MNNENLPLLKKLDNEWKLDAKEEDIKYFYHTEETASVLSGEKYMIIGRKGEGKTAIATFIYKNVGAGAYADKLSFKNFPFNTIYNYSDNRYPNPSQYITFWKYLIYVSICKQMVRDNNIDSNIRDNLVKLFPAKKRSENLKDLIPKITVKEFGFQVLSTGLNIATSREKHELEWIDIVDILENVILENVTSASKYYVIFDELDEEYKDFTSSEEEKDYFALVTGLFKAINETRNIFKDEGLLIYPIVFLRSDIFQRINYSDKNKWSDYLINLEWSPEKLQDLIQLRIDALTTKKSKNFIQAWHQIALPGDIKMGKRKTVKMRAIDYILRSTHHRPRDVVKFLKEASKIADKKKNVKISPNDIKDADSSFSEYMRQEIIDEIYSVLPEYEEIFAILSTIRKQTFHPKEFVNIYDQKVSKGELKNRGAELVLKILFEFSIIGNVPSVRTRSIFKYENESARFNFKENIQVHRGLYKALQIF